MVKLTVSFVAALRIGLASARANLVPMLILQMLAAALVVAYNVSAGFRDVLAVVADWHERWGRLSAFLSQGFFCGLLPGLFLAFHQLIRPSRLALTILAQVVWCGTCGIACNELFRLMAAVLGDSPAWPVVLS